MLKEDKPFKLTKAVDLSARAALGAMFNDVMRNLGEAYEIPTSDITPTQTALLGNTLNMLTAIATELIVQNANTEQLEKRDWYAGIDWGHAQRLTMLNKYQQYVVCEFEYNGTMIANPFLDEHHKCPVNPVKYYGEAFLNSGFCRRPQSAGGGFE